MKKVLSLVLALVLVLGIANFAFAEGDVYTDKDGNTYKKFDDVKLTLLFCWNGGYQTADDQYNNDVAAAIREKIGVTVEIEGIMMSETEKLNMMFASGDMPDIVDAPYWGGTGGETGVIKKAATEGRLIDIKDLVPNYPNIADAYDVGVVSLKYLENDLDDPIFEGARYVLPRQVAGDDADITNWAYGVFVRGDVPGALGIDPTTVKTTEDLYDFMKKAQEYGFKDVNGNDCIIASSYHNGWGVGNLADNFNDKKLTSYCADEDGKVTMDILTQNWVDKQLFIWKLVNEGILDVECFTTNDDLAYEKTGNGTTLFTTAQYGVTINATKQTGLYDTHPEMRYVPVGPLNFRDGSPAAQLEANGRSGSPVLFFPTTCTNVEAALTWLDYVNSPEGQILTAYGFEGDTFEFNEAGQPRMNAELTARYTEDSDGVKKELRARGIGYISNDFYVARKTTLWFGETEPFQADAAIPELDAYKKVRPVEKLAGYPINAVQSLFEGYNEYGQDVLDSDKQDSYVKRAYFAETEEEARSILEEYQEYVKADPRTQQLLDFLTEQFATRDDFIY
jgi:putative aldouronate transport system substrate-binding protein